ncbi:hypothetical protein V6N13_068919 [Hibiscus sabdariffa]
MGIELGGWSSGAADKTCDACELSAAVNFRRADWVFLCLNCDSSIYSGHQRVLMCEVCERAPATVTCKVDAAALCVTCDAANSLARTVAPFFDSADSTVKSSPFSFLMPTDHDAANCKQEMEETNSIETVDLFFSEMDPFIDFDLQNPSRQLHNAAMDSVVPVQTKAATIPPINNGNRFEFDFRRGSELPTFSHQTPPSLRHSVSSSSLEVGTVPTMADPNAPISSSSTNNQTIQAVGIDREARVLRYKEKRKNRKFEKTIRYASRKAYAESRPRIKGRFIKRAENDDVAVIGHMFDSSSYVFVPDFVTDTEYSVVPSF